MVFVAEGVLGAAQRVCDNPNVTVHFSNKDDGETGCRGAAAAIAFLDAQGFRTDMAIAVHFVASIEEIQNGTLYGCFNRDTKKVVILEFAACREMTQAREGFDLALSRQFHLGIVVHEVAHAIADGNFNVAQPPWIASEYIAYVTQFATMTERLRQRILAAHPVTAFDSVYQINDMMLTFNPERFGVKSYLHFRLPENGRRFLDDLRSGKINLFQSMP